MSLDQNHDKPIEKIDSKGMHTTQEELAGALLEPEDNKEVTLEKDNIINFDQAIKNRQRRNDDELRKYVLNNTKSF